MKKGNNSYEIAGMFFLIYSLFMVPGIILGFDHARETIAIATGIIDFFIGLALVFYHKKILGLAKVRVILGTIIWSYVYIMQDSMVHVAFVLFSGIGFILLLFGEPKKIRKTVAIIIGALNVLLLLLGTGALIYKMIEVNKNGNHTVSSFNNIPTYNLTLGKLSDSWKVMTSEEINRVSPNANFWYTNPSTHGQIMITSSFGLHGQNMSNSKAVADIKKSLKNRGSLEILFEKQEKYKNYERTIMDIFQTVNGRQHYSSYNIITKNHMNFNIIYLGPKSAKEIHKSEVNEFFNAVELILIPKAKTQKIEIENEPKTDEAVFEHKSEEVNQDFSEKFSNSKKLAEEGDAKAQNSLGICYKNGEGVKKDLSKAAYWYKKSAEQGHKYGQNNLGWCYKNGAGVEKDFSKAVSLFKKAANQGSSDAQNNLGICYKKGEGVKKDLAQAVYWYKKSAEQGHKYGQNNLGWCYKNGAGVEKNFSKAVSLFKKAANQGSSGAQNNLGICYRKGQGVKKDLTLAVYWYKKSAKQENKYALNNLGWCYKNGIGVVKDYDKAASLFKKSATQGYAKAQYNLGLCFEKGLGTDINLSEARYWINKSAKSGNKKAITWVNHPKNSLTLFDQYIKTAKQGDSRSQYYIGWCYEQGTGVKKNPSKAVDWYKKSAKKRRSSRAQYRLGLCFEKGFGLDKNLTEATYWISKSAATGNKKAIAWLNKSKNSSTTFNR